MKKTALCVATVIMCCSLALGQTYKVLWSFGGFPNDGASPLANLASDSAANLYGTTFAGGDSVAPNCSGCGTVFELSPNGDGTWTENVLYSFCTNYSNFMCPDGRNPEAGLTVDAAGNLYGTTYQGGAAGGCPEGSGCGTVFELSPPLAQGGAWTETVLYSFCAIGRCLDGALPTSQLILDGSGNLFGTTTGGGTGSNAGGTVFELSPNAGGWMLTTLYSFCVNAQGGACPDGADPSAGLTFDKAGNLYGTTQLGGAEKTRGVGTVYELSPGSNGWTETVLIGFAWTGNLAFPMGTVSFDPAGNLYSTAATGSLSPGGVFELLRKTRTERSFRFNGTSEGGHRSLECWLTPKPEPCTVPLWVVAQNKVELSSR